ncbi:hypothetical protein ACIA5E_29305 [Nocardia asteroides]
MNAAILALILGLVSVIAVTVWWPNPADRAAPSEDRGGAASRLNRDG